MVSLKRSASARACSPRRVGELLLSSLTSAEPVERGVVGITVRGAAEATVRVLAKGIERVLDAGAVRMLEEGTVRLLEEGTVRMLVPSDELAGVLS